MGRTLGRSGKFQGYVLHSDGFHLDKFHRNFKQFPKPFVRRRFWWWRRRLHRRANIFYSRANTFYNRSSNMSWTMVCYQRAVRKESGWLRDQSELGRTNWDIWHSRAMHILDRLS
jgi:hypothetical protein